MFTNTTSSDANTMDNAHIVILEMVTYYKY